MSIVESSTSLQQKRDEDFPVESFRHLEAKLQEIRRVVMNCAADIADKMDSHPTVYRVEKTHIDRALQMFLADCVAAQRLLGLDQTQREPGY